jgi:hypothetical protein
MMPSLLIVHVQSLERAVAADKAAKMERCKLGGATDIKPTMCEDPATCAKFEDAGLDPDTDSKQALGGKNGGGVPKSDIHKSNNSQSQPKTQGEKGCNDVHFHSIRDKKGCANAADARADGWRIVKGFKSNKTGIQSWRLIQRTFI